MKKFILTNSFHDTEITVLVTDPETSQSQVWQDLQQAANREYRSGPARAKVNRIRRTLCGMSDCCCGTVRA